MIKNEIMKIIYDSQAEIDREVEELTQKLNNGDILVCEYTADMDVLEGKIEVLSGLENKLINCAEK